MQLNFFILGSDSVLTEVEAAQLKPQGLLELKRYALVDVGVGDGGGGKILYICVHITYICVCVYMRVCMHVCLCAYVCVCVCVEKHMLY